MVKISFDFLEVKFDGFDAKLEIIWLKNVLKSHDCKSANLSFIFVSDDFLLDMNRSFLNHDYYTDIITFSNNEENSLSGEMYISLDRVRENAALFADNDFGLELDRVMCHGVLHLLGFNDKTDLQKARMRKEEDKCLMLKSVSRETK